MKLSHMLELPTWLYTRCPVFDTVSQVRAPQGNYKMTSKGAMKMQPKANELRFMTKNDGCVHVHPSSVNYMVRLKKTKEEKQTLDSTDKEEQAL